MNAAQVNADITALLRSRHTLLWVQSPEELRVERALVTAAADATFPIRFWDCSIGGGIKDAEGRLITAISDPTEALRYIADNKDRAVYVMRDLHGWFDQIVVRTLRSLARTLQTVPKNEARAIILLTPPRDAHPDLVGVPLIPYPLPDRAEVGRILDETMRSVPEDMRTNAVPNRDAAIDAALGLTGDAVQNCYARSLVTTRTVDPVLVANEKRRVIARASGITWYDPDPRGLDAIGGLDLLKPWLTARRSAFSARARAFGLPTPKGALLVGVPGCGKSLTAKAIASAWQMPLLRLDMGATQSKYVGESQANIRSALAIAETVSPCVLWVDEIEKALAGAMGPQGDGGVATDALGTLLSWMQERKGQVFVIATANDVRGLPPELLRKGRFDELFWVDLPTTTERTEILRATLTAHERTTDGIDLAAVSGATEGFTGAEIAALVPDALFEAFADGERTITTVDLCRAAATVAPLSKTAAEKIAELRAWAKGRARPASTPESTAASLARALDL